MVDESHQGGQELVPAPPDFGAFGEGHPQARTILGVEESKVDQIGEESSSLLLTALPEAQKDEMIATQSLSPLAIVAKLMVAYQPGGLAEKGIVLRALEQREEAESLPMH